MFAIAATYSPCVRARVSLVPHHASPARAFASFASRRIRSASPCGLVQRSRNICAVVAKATLFTVIELLVVPIFLVILSKKSHFQAMFST